jgi:hypothetical protein
MALAVKTAGRVYPDWSVIALLFGVQVECDQSLEKDFSPLVRA